MPIVSHCSDLNVHRCSLLFICFLGGLPRFPIPQLFDFHPARCSIYGTVRTHLPMERPTWSFQARFLQVSHCDLKHAKWLEAGTDPVAVVIEAALDMSPVPLACT